MHTIIEGYQTTGAFARTYYKQYLNGKLKPVSITTIQKMAERERLNPGSTGLDFIQIAGLNFVRQTPAAGQSVAITDPGDPSALQILEAIVAPVIEPQPEPTPATDGHP